MRVTEIAGIDLCFLTVQILVIYIVESGLLILLGHYTQTTPALSSHRCRIAREMADQIRTTRIGDGNQNSATSRALMQGSSWS